MNPSRVRIAHIIVFQGAPLVVGEEAIAVARNPDSPASRAAVEFMTGLANSVDPGQKAEGTEGLRELAAAYAVRAVMADPQKYAAVVDASEAGDEAALAIRQGAIAARISDVKSAAEELAMRVASGDKDARDRARALLQSALQGDVVARAASACFTNTLKALPPSPVSAITTTGVAVVEPAPAKAECTCTKDPLEGKPVGVEAAILPDEAAVAWFREQGIAPPPAEAVSERADPLIVEGAS